MLLFYIMKKKLLKIVILLAVLVTYLIVGKKFNIFIKCPIHEIFHVYCPGCGLTRMLLAFLKLDFYQAFRYNPLLFILTPLAILLLIEQLYSDYKKKKSIYHKIPNYVWYILIALLLIYAILRNIYPCLAPTVL